MSGTAINPEDRASDVQQRTSAFAETAPRCGAFGAGRLAFWCSFLSLAAASLSTSRLPAQDTPAALPFVGTDAVSVLNDRGREEILGGSIEQILGERLTLRQNGRGGIRVIRMTDIARLSFHRSLGWDEGLTLQQENKPEQALARFDRALNTERRDWAWRELQATAARLCVRMGRRDEAVERIEQILEKDERSRHVSLLPLVWDARMPADERIIVDPADLHSPTAVRRLVAASALLHETDHRAAAKSVLQRILQAEGLSRLGELARTQLWRLHLLEEPADRNPVLRVWADRVREMPVDARAGPQYVVAREFQHHHDYDRAALGFLWLPLMASTDEPLAAQSLSEAIECLQRAGRPQAAEELSRELVIRFPEAAATKRLKTPARSASE